MPGTDKQTANANSSESSQKSVVTTKKGHNRKRGSSSSMRDINAPKMPKNGYILFMIKRRKELKGIEPDLTLQELSTRIGHEWAQLDEKKKMEFLDKAKEEKRGYNEEMAAYKKTDSYKQFQQKIEKAKKRSFQSTEDGALSNVCTGSDIPIFTDQFLEQNREREAELRGLRREVTRLEDEQTNLRKRISQLETGQHEMEQETDTKRKQNQIIRKQLDCWRQKLAEAFSSLPLPESGLKPTVSTIDSYLNSVHKLVLDAPSNHQNFIVHVRQIASRLKLPDCSN